MSYIYYSYGIGGSNIFVMHWNTSQWILICVSIAILAGKLEEFTTNSIEPQEIDENLN